MQRELKVIENLGLIVRVGSKKTGHWEVINKGLKREYGKSFAFSFAG